MRVCIGRLTEAAQHPDREVCRTVLHLLMGVLSRAGCSDNVWLDPVEHLDPASRRTFLIANGVLQRPPDTLRASTVKALLEAWPCLRGLFGESGRLAVTMGQVLQAGGGDWRDPGTQVFLRRHAATIEDCFVFLADLPGTRAVASRLLETRRLTSHHDFTRSVDVTAYYERVSLAGVQRLVCWREGQGVTRTGAAGPVRTSRGLERVGVPYTQVLEKHPLYDTGYALRFAFVVVALAQRALAHRRFPDDAGSELVSLGEACLQLKEDFYLQCIQAADAALAGVPAPVPASARVPVPVPARARRL